MRTYILFNSIRKIPERRDVLTYIFDNSFRERPYCGFGRQYEKGKVQSDHYHWGKWQDNPNIPFYAHSTHIWVIYPPIKEYISKNMLAIMKELKYKYYAQIRLEKYKPPIIDHRAYHRCVYKYSLSTNGKIYDSKSQRLFTPDNYYKLNKEIIERPFHIHLTKYDLKRI